MNEADRIYDNTKVIVRDVPGRGRGLIAAQNIGTGDVIVSAPVLVLSGVEYYLMRILPCIMHTFVWERPQAEGGETAAIAFGLVSLCNHSEENANAKAVRVFEAERLDLVALKPIDAGTEILIQYRSVPFEPQ